MDYGRGAGIVVSAATGVAATNSEAIYSSLPNTGVKSLYLALGDFTVVAVVAMAAIAVAYKIAITIKARG